MYTIQSELLANFYHGAFSNTLILPQTIGVTGYYANWDTGKLNKNDKYFCSPYLRALNGTIIFDTTPSADNVVTVSFYDSNFNMLSSVYNKTIVPIPKTLIISAFQNVLIRSTMLKLLATLLH